MTPPTTVRARFKAAVIGAPSSTNRIVSSLKLE
jgi:hypothetical protein